MKIEQNPTTTKPTTSPASHPATTFAQLSDFPSLVIDPTLPDPLPRLPVWHISVKQGSVGWTADDSPVMKSGGAWALGTRDWRALDEKTEKTLFAPEDVPPAPEFKLDLPATAPSTNPTSRPATSPTLVGAGEKPLLRDPDGNWYFDGKTSLKVISKTGKVTIWPLPATPVGESDPWLARPPQ